MNMRLLFVAALVVGSVSQLPAGSEENHNFEYDLAKNLRSRFRKYKLTSKTIELEAKKRSYRDFDVKELPTGNVVEPGKE